MKIVTCLLLCAATASPLSAAAETLGLRPSKSLSYTEFGGSYVHESVSNQPNDWTDTQFDVLHKFGERKILIGRLGAVERFGLRDSTFALAGYHPLGERTTGHAEVTVSDNHRFLPRNSVYVQLAHSLGGGWAAAAGLKRAHYDNATVDIADLTLEHYFSTFRAAATVLPSHSSTAGSAASYRLQLGHYYGTENNVQLVLAKGDEVDTPIAAGIIVKTPVQSTAVFGRHWFARDWAITYSVGRTRQGASTRDALGVGLRYRF